MEEGKGKKDIKISRGEGTMSALWEWLYRGKKDIS